MKPNSVQQESATPRFGVLLDTSPRGAPEGATPPLLNFAVQEPLPQSGTPLIDVTFCVVDLETTGGSADADAITEIGAVKVRAGEVLGEFHTLVNPHRAIPAAISSLTGITHTMVRAAPSIDAVLPSFLEFARGCVLVAHNAGFDIGFLKAACAQVSLSWPHPAVLDTVTLARGTLIPGEVRNHKLSTLAAHFHSPVTPNHRALDDARATVEVLHGLIARVGTQGVLSLEELQGVTRKVSPQQRRKRHLSDHLPHAPGVYLFRGPQDEVLYVGTSKDLKRRVRTYFTTAETRRRMGQMVALAERVEGIVCATALEASVRELRLIGAHNPPFNRRSRHSEREFYVRLTREPWPRLSIVRQAPARDSGSGDFLGPFRRHSTAEVIVAALHDAFAIRQCTSRMPRRPDLSPCVLGELQRCVAPCTGEVEPETYRALVEEVSSALVRSPDAVGQPLMSRMLSLATAERFEEAATVKSRLSGFLRGSVKTARVRALAELDQVTAAARNQQGHWEVHVVRHGRLAGAGVIPPRVDAMTYVRELEAQSEQVQPPLRGFAARVEEIEIVRSWLETPGTRLISVDGDWTWPVNRAWALLSTLTQRSGQPGLRPSAR